VARDEPLQLFLVLDGFGECDGRHFTDGMNMRDTFFVGRRDRSVLEFVSANFYVDGKKKS